MDDINDDLAEGRALAQYQKDTYFNTDWPLLPFSFSDNIRFSSHGVPYFLIGDLPENVSPRLTWD